MTIERRRDTTTAGLDRQVRVRQFELCNRNAVRGLIAGFGGTPLVGFGLFGTAWPRSFMVWLGCVFLVQAIQLTAEVRYVKGHRPPPERWAPIALAFGLTLGSLWGIGAVVFFDDQPHHLGVLALMMFVVISSTAMANASVLPNVYVMIVPAALPFVIRAAISTELLSMLAGAAVGLLAMVLCAYAHGMNATIVQAIRTGIENRRLNEALTEQRVQERTRVIEAASRHKSEFLATMSHELRTPLNAIIGYSEMLHEDADARNARAEMADLSKISGAGRQLLELVNSILDLSKIEAGRMEVRAEATDIEWLLREIEDVCIPLVRQQDNELAIRIDASLGSVVIDAGKTRQVLLNLVANAAKFTRGGKIDVTVDRRVAGEQAWIEFTVGDTGIGMSPRQLSELFQDFTQVDDSASRRMDGTGLGLALSRRLCRLMGGDISVTSEPGEGSLFTVRLPLQGIPHATVPIAAGPDRTPRRLGGTVLVIDDDPGVRELLSRCLSRDGYEVLTAADGSEGLRLARERRPEVITLDVVMPEVDGWAVLSALKADPALQAIPVIILSILDDRKTGFALGAADYLTKPVDRNRLSMAMASWSRNASVLVVDDDETLRSFLLRILAAEGHVVIQAGNGLEALERMREATPDAVLLDLLMPGMDGFEFMAALRAEPAWRDVPIIIVTAKELTDADLARLNGSVGSIVEKRGQRFDALMVDVRRLVTAALKDGRGVTDAPKVCP